MAHETLQRFDLPLWRTMARYLISNEMAALYMTGSRKLLVLIPLACQEMCFLQTHEKQAGIASSVLIAAGMNRETLHALAFSYCGLLHNGLYIGSQSIQLIPRLHLATQLVKLHFDVFSISCPDPHRYKLPSTLTDLNLGIARSSYKRTRSCIDFVNLKLVHFGMNTTRCSSLNTKFEKSIVSFVAKFCGNTMRQLSLITIAALNLTAFTNLQSLECLDPEYHVLGITMPVESFKIHISSVERPVLPRPYICSGGAIGCPEYLAFFARIQRLELADYRAAKDLTLLTNLVWLKLHVLPYNASAIDVTVAPSSHVVVVVSGQRWVAVINKGTGSASIVRLQVCLSPQMYGQLESCTLDLSQVQSCEMRDGTDTPRTLALPLRYVAKMNNLQHLCITQGHPLGHFRLPSALPSFSRLTSLEIAVSPDEYQLFESCYNDGFPALTRLEVNIVYEASEADSSKMQFPKTLRHLRLLNVKFDFEMLARLPTHIESIFVRGALSRHNVAKPKEAVFTTSAAPNLLLLGFHNVCNYFAKAESTVSLASQPPVAAPTKSGVYIPLVDIMLTYQPPMVDPATNLVKLYLTNTDIAVKVGGRNEDDGCRSNYLVVRSSSLLSKYAPI